MRKALLVIDVQQYFLKKTPKNLPRKIADYVETSKYDLLAFTTFRNTPGSNWEKSLGWYGCRSDEDIVLASEFINLANAKNTFEKHTYSALRQPDLLRQLNEKKVGQIDLCGIDIDACVLATAFDAFDHGYRVNVLLDLSYSRAGLDKAAAEIILRLLQNKSTRIPINPAFGAMIREAKLYTDGGSRGNPGPSAAAYVICKTDDSVVKKDGFYLNISTNNQAEYRGLEVGLKKAAELGIKKLSVYMDSELIIRQLNGVYKIKNKDLLPIYQEVKQLADIFEKIEFVHVPRELNKIADAEVNRVLDEKANAK
jgi:ribonuclease HI/nicotinamidase-related amidase